MAKLQPGAMLKVHNNPDLVARIKLIDEDGVVRKVRVSALDENRIEPLDFGHDILTLVLLPSLDETALGELGLKFFGQIFKAAKGDT